MDTTSPARETRHRPWYSRLRLWLVAAFFALPATGGVLTFLDVYQDDTAGVAGLGSASSVTVSLDQRHVYVAGAADDAIAIFTLDATSETLVFSGLVENLANGVFGLDGVNAVATSPDSRHLYATGKLDNSIVVFSRSASSDDLVFRDILQEGVGGVFGIGEPSDVLASHDGRHVYVSGKGTDSVAVFARDASSDSLIYVEAEVDGFGGVLGLAGASALAMSPNDEFLFTVGQQGDAVLTFARDATTDDLAFRATSFSVNAPNDVAVSPDGRHLYVSSSVTGGIAHHEIQANGALTLQGVFGSAITRAVAVSDSGRYVFAGSPNFAEIRVYSRDPATGALTEVDVVANGAGGVSGLSGLRQIAADPQGRFLFSAARADSAVALFRAALFADGFESGDTTLWSDEVPPSP